MIYLLLFIEFFKIGLFCFGGGFGMIPLIEETAEKHNWLTESQFYNFVGVCESTPGPIAVNMATYIGSVQGGILGSVCATLGVVTPSFIIILLIASVLEGFTKNRFFKSFIKGVDPVITALILSTGVILAAKALGYAGAAVWNTDMVSLTILLLLAAVYFTAQKLFRKKITAIWIIILSAVLGIIVSVISKQIL